MKGILKGIGWFIFYFLLMAFIQQGMVFIGAGTTNMDESMIYMEDHMLMIGVISNVLIGLILFLLFYFRKTGIKEEWQLKSFNKKDLMYAMMFVFSYSMLSNILIINQPSSMAEILNHSIEYYGTPWGFILKVLNLLLLAPVVEEIALRGIVYTRIRKSASVCVSMLISGVLFGLMHIMAGGFILVIQATVMGLILGYLMYRYDSLWLCVDAHIAANLSEFLFMNAQNYSAMILFVLEIVFVVLLGFSFFKIVRSDTHTYNGIDF